MQVTDQWWGDFSLDEGQAMQWCVGPRQFVVQRHASEWTTWDVKEPEPDFVELICTHEAVLDDRHNIDCMSRHLFKNTDNQIRVLPALADRSVITRPSAPLVILPNGEGRLFVSTPLWFQIYMSKGVCFFDQPFWRPSDSWFGPSTIEGEICYSKYTDARLRLDLIDPRVHRAITPLNVINNSSEPLVVDRLNVPVPMLSLYSAGGTQLWTQSMTITRSESNDAVTLTLDKTAPSEAGQATIVSGPRIDASKHRLIRSLNSLFA